MKARYKRVSWQDLNRKGRLVPIKVAHYALPPLDQITLCNKRIPPTSSKIKTLQGLPDCEACLKVMKRAKA